MHGAINSYDATGPHSRCIVSSTVMSDEVCGGCRLHGGWCRVGTCVRTRVRDCPANTGMAARCMDRSALMYGWTGQENVTGPSTAAAWCPYCVAWCAQRIVMYGGCAQNGGTGGPCPARDAWTFDGSSWKQASTCPTPRTRGVMVPLTSPLLSLPTSADMAAAAAQEAMMGPGRTGSGGIMGPDSLNQTAGLRVYGGRYVLLYGGYERDKQTISVSSAPDDQLPVLDLDNGEWLLLRASGEVPAFRCVQGASAHTSAAAPAMPGYVWTILTRLLT